MGIDPNTEGSTKQAAGQLGQRGARLGVLMLDTRFPRWPGDIGNDAGFVMPVLRERVQGAVPAAVVTDADALAASGWAERFAAAAMRLQQQGAGAITTSCGFLVLLQPALQAAVSVPLVSSSLLQLPALLATEPRVGVLTIDARRLGAAHLLAAGVDCGRLGDVLIEGVDPDSRFARDILADRPERDRAQAEADLVQAALRLRESDPSLRTVVLECTNMPPHAAALQQATGLRLRWLRHDPALAAFFLPDGASP
ncbi:aspartate/glutamate racemase family protein [Aquabacterium sp.]|uniref:aspartate/glutamate racemase family protein n=1 Tax=Aquabacterium sp. TaxID=1872578 RepID=UPI002BFD19C8|nr:aspartate/glutamate racemase family protein [Aquabacterium sp.]HSW06199.1 aspartate/glutamate racemase family protein [Aquabacterium sp.]